jgi:hypothetical protein
VVHCLVSLIVPWIETRGPAITLLFVVVREALSRMMMATLDKGLLFGF